MSKYVTFSRGTKQGSERVAVEVSNEKDLDLVFGDAKTLEGISNVRVRNSKPNNSVRIVTLPMYSQFRKSVLKTIPAAKKKTPEYKIKISWCVEDVQGHREELTLKQAIAVLVQAKTYFDASVGINWDVLSSLADDVLSDGIGSTNVSGGPDFSITNTWGIADIKNVRADLTDEQAIEVLKAIDNSHDANEGVNWEVISTHADILYPEG